jgi:integrase
MNSAENLTQAVPKESPWEKSSISNLVRWKSSKIYFARVKINGRLIRKSLDTPLMSVARNRLAELVKQERERAEVSMPNVQGKMTFAEAVVIYLERLDGNPDLKPSTKKYRRQCVKAIIKTWPGIEATELRKITKAACQEWARRLRQHGTKFRPPGAKKEREGISSSRFNNTVTTLRQILKLGVETGIIVVTPVQEIKRARVIQKELVLPSRAHFPQFVKLIEDSGAGQAKDCANLVRFLAFSGCRISEATRVTWRDIDGDRDEIVVRGDPETGTKNWEIRRIPMIPELKALLSSLRQERLDEPAEAVILEVRECQKSMDRAAALLGIPRITHHDLRHLFATTAIESGIDIPTVSRLLGHKDGGVLAMKTYGHLRQEHAKAAVQKIKFNVSNSPDRQ